MKPTRSISRKRLSPDTRAKNPSEVATQSVYLTPIVAATGLVFHGFLWSGFGVGSVGVALAISLDAIALALLGPGAYSINSYRFGRRVVVLPPPPEVG
jgi:hypothetical protein